VKINIKFVIYICCIIIKNIIHKYNNKPKATTKVTTIEIVDCDWCIVKMISVTVLCESDIILITICHLSSYEICFDIIVNIVKFI
jgi:hypothetical protein